MPSKPAFARNGKAPASPSGRRSPEPPSANTATAQLGIWLGMSMCTGAKMSSVLCKIASSSAWSLFASARVVTHHCLRRSGTRPCSTRALSSGPCELNRDLDEIEAHQSQILDAIRSDETRRFAG
ncbi:hypothetical protein PaG_04643 [Moesziomyces aphidis]|uniref:Uncharacterized protein n=1 Tax=Moesziomyces aphidis TaxID=84754 RepID=W3VGR1_MOEAP|nr:hypothetical protein PaG_04643 [Moesziomyces aphidis]